MQVNGYMGVDFSGPNLTAESFAKACTEMIAAGTTAFVPTLITSSQSIYKRNLPIIAEVIESPEFRGKLLGIHLEGPFISPKPGARGAHDKRFALAPDAVYLRKLLDWARGTVRMLTIAAEGEGAEELTRIAVDHGVTVCLGHQMATEEDLDRLVNAGAKAVTHLGNGVPDKLDRHRNPLFAALANDSLAATIITDGHHLPPSLIKIILRVKGLQNCIVISDIVHLAGLAPGTYQFNGRPTVLSESGMLRSPDTGYLTGSSATMLECMNHLASLNLLNSDELAAAGFYNPLRLIDVRPEAVSPGPQISYDQQMNRFSVSSK